MVCRNAIVCVTWMVVAALGPGLALAQADTGSAEVISYAADLEPLIVDACAGCHNADEPKADLILEEGFGWESLVDKHSTQETEEFLVVPGDPEASWMWLKVTHTQTTGKGMPRTLFGSKKLRGAELELIESWILGGAQP